MKSPLIIFSSVLLFSATASISAERDVLNAVETIGGVYSSIFVHEVGHALALKAFGATDIEIEVPRKGSLLSGVTRSVPPLGGFTPGQAKLIAASGLLAANVAGEIVMQRQGLHGSPFAQSLVGTALVSNVRHVFSYYTKVRGINGYGGNDIDHYELAGGNPHVLSTALIAYTVWTLHRMRHKEIPLFYVNLRF
jgi:hypothetical protein